MFRFLFAALFCAGIFTAAQAATIAYQVDAGTAGNQSYGQVLGMTFNVNTAVNVTSLGAFDDNSDGIVGTIVTELWSAVGNTGVAILASASFSSGDQGTLIGASRFKSLVSALLLGPGNYAIVSYGYSSSDQNGNKGISGAWTTNSGAGALTFTGGGRYGGVGGTTIGNFVDSGPEDRYAAGTFAFDSVASVPLPASLPLLVAGLALLGFRGRRNRH